MIIGVIGLGTVGFGTVDILTKEKERLEKTIGEEVVVKYGCALEDVKLPMVLFIHRIIMKLSTMKM